MERWVRHREHIGKVRPRTAVVYRGYIARWIVPKIGRIRLAKLRPDDVQRVIDDAIEGGLSPRSVVQIHRIMHAAFKQAVRWKAMTYNPSDGVTPPEVKRLHPRIPEADAVARLLASIDPAYRAPVALAAATGLRRSEACGLRWVAVMLDGKQPTLRVEGGLHRVRGDLIVQPPKSETSERVIPLPAVAAAMLKRHRVEQDERRLIAGPAWMDGDFVFDRGDGRPIDPDDVTRAFRVARTKAGLEGVRLHDLRHAFASLLVAAGTDPKLVSELMGHSDVSFTLRVYVHPDDEARAAAAQTVDDVYAKVLG
jgi:integrase